MPDSLNERMAAALAPVLGEAAVYTREFVCRYGHKTTEKQWQFRKSIGAYECAHEDASGKWCAQPLHASTTEPKDFADPAVGWGLFEKWAENTGYGWIVQKRLDPWDGVTAEVYGRPGESWTAIHEKALVAVLSALAQALGLEVSGDA